LDRQQFRLAAVGLLASSEVPDEIWAMADNHIGNLLPYLGARQNSA
jgi:hypothetical protein